MPALILVTTPHTAFGELLRLSLEEQGPYQVRLIQTAKEVRAALTHNHFQMVVIDSDLREEPFVPFVLELMAQHPRTRVVIIPPENNPNHPSLGGLIPHGYIHRPFYLPDLMELTNRLLSDSSSQPQQAESVPEVVLPNWLQDSTVLQAYLEKQVEASQAVAALLGNGGKLCANTGALPLPAAQEMASVLLRYWDREEKTDLMRFVRLNSIKGDYLVYVTEVVDGIVLIMAYEPGVSISLVRPQTRAIAQKMASNPPTSTQKEVEKHAEAVPAIIISKNGSEPKPAPDPVASYNNSQGGQPSHEIQTRSAVLESATEPIESVPAGPAPEEQDQSHTTLPEAELARADEDEISEGEEPETFNLSLLLGNVPSPDPGQEDLRSKFGTTPTGLGWVREVDQWNPNASPDNGSLTRSEPVAELEPNMNAVPDEAYEERLLEESAGLSLLDSEPQIDPLSDTRPHVISTISHIQQFEPATPALSLLNYTCVLLPRLPQHYLTGDLADKLAQWVQQFCLAFGWRLEGISIRPDYLQWTIQVAPSVSPGNLVRIIRQRTSFSIFNTFEHLKIQNPSGDFWAVGYLIVSGSQPPSAQLLRDYITQTRKRQGITKF